MSTLAVFPFGNEMMPLLRDCSLTEFNTILPINPFIPECHGQDACILDHGPKTFITIDQDFIHALSNCSSILFTKDPNEDIIEHVYMEYLAMAYQQKKRIYITSNLYNQLSCENQSLCRQSHILEWNNKIPKLANRNLHDIEIPVVAVWGSGFNCNKFDLMLALRSLFIQEGYRVYQLGTKHYSALFGFPTLPAFLFHNFSIRDKILMFNQYLFNEIESSKPDICLLAAPGGIALNSKENSAKFEEYVYVLTTAARPDVAIRSLYTDSYTDNFIKEDRNYCKYHLSREPDIYHIANVITETAEHEKAIHYQFINYSIAMTSATQYLSKKLPLICQAHDKVSMAYVCRHIIRKFI